MDPNLPFSEDDCKQGTDSSSHQPHGTIPKWLQEISQKVEDSSEVSHQKHVTQFFESLEHKTRPTVSQSARYGRRASITAQLLGEVPSSTLKLTSTEYLVPSFEEPIDFKGLHPAADDVDLERSWKSLDNFKLSHKGRLDSAKNVEDNEKTAFDFLSPISSSNDDSSESELYSPLRPMRSRSEMSVYTRDKFDPIFEKKLNDYQLNVDKENKLRTEIICELLAENERITERLKQNHAENDVFYYAKQKSTNKAKKEHERIFIIPELPKGRRLIIDILSTWGDKYYVGLNGIEIFDVYGRLVDVKKIRAVPPDVNILPECSNDPRVISNILDGVNRTQDDMHIWLAPFEKGCSHIITMEFFHVVTVAMIRIWNYNKSRIHSYRGVRDIVIFLDEQPIFKGEIAKACGGILGGLEAFGDTILFTTDELILEKISKNDTWFTFLVAEQGAQKQSVVERPLTAAKVCKNSSRPITGVNQQTSPSHQEEILFGTNEMELVLLSNWGHAKMIGLTGLEVVQHTDSVIKLTANNLRSPNGGNLSVLLADNNITTNPNEMWWTNFELNEQVSIKLTFDEFKYISKIRIWNYNASLETSYCGVRALKILLDGKPVQNPVTKNEIFILRRAPGNCHYDYVQELHFAATECSESSLLSRSECYEPSTMPEGFVVQIIIFSTWGDQYYCGLNGLELFNQDGKAIVLEEQNVCAYPESVNSLPNVSGDTRTPEKLIDGVNTDATGCHSWLAPIISNHLNRIYIVMDAPIVVSLVKMWNYSKTPTRGVKEFGILMDDLLIYNGMLRQWTSGETYQSVLFTENEEIIGDDFETLVKNSTFVQDVILMDEDGRGTSGTEADPALRPYTSVSLANK